MRAITNNQGNRAIAVRVRTRDGWTRVEGGACVFLSRDTRGCMLHSFALGRGLDYYDMPTVRAIVRDTAKDHYRLSSIVLGIVNSQAFREDQIPVKAPGEPPASLSHTAAKL